LGFFKLEGGAPARRPAGRLPRAAAVPRRQNIALQPAFAEAGMDEASFTRF
jgi:methyl-accepting chemotaxis protein